MLSPFRNARLESAGRRFISFRRSFYHKIGFVFSNRLLRIIFLSVAMLRLLLCKRHCIIIFLMCQATCCSFKTPGMRADFAVRIGDASYDLPLRENIFR